MIALGIFNFLGPFFQVFGQVKKWLILELHKIRVPYAVASPLIFILLCDLGRHGGVFQFIKIGQFLIIFDSCGRKILGRSWRRSSCPW